MPKKTLFETQDEQKNLKMNLKKGGLENDRKEIKHKKRPMFGGIYKNNKKTIPGMDFPHWGGTCELPGHAHEDGMQAVAIRRPRTPVRRPRMSVEEPMPNPKYPTTASTGVYHKSNPIVQTVELICKLRKKSKPVGHFCPEKNL